MKAKVVIKGSVLQATLAANMRGLALRDPVHDEARDMVTGVVVGIDSMLETVLQSWYLSGPMAEPFADGQLMSWEAL